MSAKQTGLAQFSINQTHPVTQRETTPDRRTRGKHETVMLSFRCPKADWPRIHQLAISEGVSIQELIRRGLSKIFEEKGLDGI